MNNWVSYQNGNYSVHINTMNGTKIRKNDLDYFEPEWPESADIKITNCCKHGCSMCFPENTYIVMSDDVVKPIQDIKIGDNVLSYDINSNRVVSNNVKQLFKNPFKGELIVLQFEDNSVVKCTPNHKILTNAGFKQASELTPEDEIISI